MGAGALYIVIFVLIFNWNSRSHSFYHLLFLSECLFLMNTTKMLYHQPRPYFVDDEINSLESCTAEYGNPSGHSLFSAAFFMFIYLDVWHIDSQKRKESQTKWLLSLFGCVFMFILIGFARLYVGAHSMNQILYGWLLGIWIALYNHYCFREFIIDHIETVIHRKSRYQQRKNFNITQSIIVATALFLTVYFIQILTYIIVDVTFTADPIWEQRIYLKCSNIEAGTRQMFNDKSVLFASITVIVYTSYLALISNRRQFGATWPDMYKTSIKKVLLRFVIIGLLCGLPGLIILIKFQLDIAILIIIKTAVCMIIGFLLFGVTHYFFVKFDLLNNENKNENDDEECETSLISQETAENKIN
ncbi:pap2 superfamily phosphatase [Stylonychia lemnae]|uniref:Pap2 superfamily phosphatase n=1 Tax=Stylonychia lemnae TaxID=5949 RepID=A0A078B0X4_STYLE|nr:pap2 superfamily phosphatase [Stylonychia lemnae]|eukprot:CDW88209.1 pap2 superfamily phosphatase [Stylonychia lemnae]